MKRRQFLLNSSAVAVSASLPFAARAGAASTSRWSLARLAPDLRFHAVDACTAETCAEGVLRVRLDALLPAPLGPVVSEFRLRALFDVAGSARTPYQAWHYRAGNVLGNSKGCSFVAARECMRTFELDYRMADTAAPEVCREQCSLTSQALPLLMPGQYVLAGPRADGRVADLQRFTFSGDPLQPLQACDGADRGFDYLAFRIESDTPEPPMPFRADLACSLS